MYAATPYSGMATAYSPAGWRRTARSFRRFGGGEIFLWRNFKKGYAEKTPSAIGRRRADMFFSDQSPLSEAERYSRLSLAMFRTEIPFGHSASQA